MSLYSANRHMNPKQHQKGAIFILAIAYMLQSVNHSFLHIRASELSVPVIWLTFKSYGPKVLARQSCSKTHHPAVSMF